MVAFRTADAIHAVSEARNFFWSGVWIHHLRRRRQELRVAKALEQHGEEAMQTRIATERARRIERYIKNWRAAPAAFESAIDAGALSHIPSADLKLLALNRDVRKRGDRLAVRRSWVLAWLAWTSLAVIVTGCALLCLLVVASPAAWSAKVIGVAIITLLFWLLWPGFGLYSTRAVAATRRSGASVEEALNSRAAGVAKIISFDQPPFQG
ncbi:hypothetical protein [Roseateles sp. P5_E8]